jgi:hypothetical protein
MSSTPVGVPRCACAWHSSAWSEQLGGGEQRERVAELRPHDQRGAQPEDDLQGEHVWILADLRGDAVRGRLAR